MEAMAYAIRTDFDRGVLPPAGLMRRIDRETGGAWGAVAPLLEEIA